MKISKTHRFKTLFLASLCTAVIAGQVQAEPVFYFRTNGAVPKSQTPVDTSPLQITAQGFPGAVELFSRTNSPIPPIQWLVTNGAAQQWSAGNLPAGLSIGSDGLVSGFVSQAGDYSSLVTASAPGPRSGSASFSLSVKDDAVVGNIPAAMKGRINKPFESAAPSLSNFFEPPQWSLKSGSLQTGLSLGQDGRITGQPTQIGSRSLVLTATDPMDHQAVDSPVTLSIYNNPTVIMNSTITGNRGLPLTYTVPVPGNLIGTATFSINNALPSGLSLNASTGIISGTVSSTAGSASGFKVTAKDSYDGATGESGAFSIVINNYPAANTRTPNYIVLRNGYANTVASNFGDPVTGYFDAGHAAMNFVKTTDQNSPQYFDVYYPEMVSASRVVFDGSSVDTATVRIMGTTDAGEWGYDKSYILAPGQNSISFPEPLYGRNLRVQFSSSSGIYRRQNFSNIKFMGN